MYMAYSPAFGFAKDEDEGEDKLEARGGQFWDGRAADLVEQPSGPLMNPARDEQSFRRRGRREGQGRQPTRR